MDRRKMLKSSGLAALGLGFTGCATRTPSLLQPVTNPRIQLATLNASWNRVIRTTVGLRPYRPSGFVVRAEKLDNKTLVHNYGHGGAGHSLAWGTGSLAADLVSEAATQGDRRVAVLGCGTVGLTAARQLQRRGFEVTIYTLSVPPDTTSNKAWAGFTPASRAVAIGGRTPAWDTQFRQAVEISYQQLQLLVGPNYGITWIDDYAMTDELRESRSAEARAEEARLLPAHMQMGTELLGPGEHPFPSTYVNRGTRMRIEPSIYLEALVRDVTQFGGRIVIRKFDTLHDLMSLTEPIVVNSTGLGSRTLFGDEELTPVKGQLTFLVPQPELNYILFGFLRNSEGSLMPITVMPRRDGIALGTTGERGVWTLEPNEESRRRTVEAHIALSNIMRSPRPHTVVARSQRLGKVPALETFFDLES